MKSLRDKTATRISDMAIIVMSDFDKGFFMHRISWEMI